MKTVHVSRTHVVALALLLWGCEPISLDPVREGRAALEAPSGAGGSGGAGSGGDGGSLPLTPQPSIAFHGAALARDHGFSDLVPTDPNVYLLFGTASVSCEAPYVPNDTSSVPPCDEMVLEVPLHLQHVGEIDLSRLRSSLVVVFPNNSGENDRLGRYASGKLEIVSIDDTNVAFNIEGSSQTGPLGPIGFDGLYSTPFCPD